MTELSISHCIVEIWHHAILGIRKIFIMQVFLLSQSEFTDITLKETLCSIILYVQIYDQFVTFNVKSVFVKLDIKKH
jgi:hypothetical protein